MQAVQQAAVAAETAWAEATQRFTGHAEDLIDLLGSAAAP